MEARQEAKLTMFRTVELHCDNNPAIIGLVVAFQTVFAIFKAKIVEIINATQLVDLSLQGITADKTNRKQNLAQMAADIAGINFAFASANGNLMLKQEMNLKFNKLITTRDDQLAPRCQNIYARATENLEALRDYGIQAPQLAAFQTAINEYQAVTPKPRTAVSQRKAQNANLRRLFKEADAILNDQMDRLVVNFRVSNPDFVAQYFSNRQIIDPATTTTQLRGKVTAKSDGAPIHNAEITVVELSKTVNTNITGNYSIKPIANGKYTIRVIKPDFNDFEIFEFEVKLGDVTTLNVALVSS
ncbi:hypothetical protein BH10ACI1_BH10ACI1_26700 [soil metagenome]